MKMLSSYKRVGTLLAKASHLTPPFKKKHNQAINRPPLPTPTWLLSKEATNLWTKGRVTHALNIHYEDLVRQKTGGSRQFIGPYEIDAITKNALIQCKCSQNASTNPKQFINDNRKQINRTLMFAKQQQKRAEFWFDLHPSDKVINYIEKKGGYVKVGLNQEGTYETNYSHHLNISYSNNKK